jgi:GT2 family glycosyltransferase
MTELSIVIVTWNCRRFVEECLVSLRAHLRIPAEIIVVDNASTDGTAEMIQERFSEVRLISSDSNLGFARANNVGVKASRGRYVALINPDVSLLDGCIDRGLAEMESNPEIGILGPRMLGPDGSVQRSGMRFPSLWNCLCDALILHKLFRRNSTFGGRLMADFGWDEPRDVDVLNGWFWFVRRQALDQVGLLDERFFMYGEDLDWCKRFRDAGWRVRFEPRATAIHYGGGSSEQAPIRFSLEMQRADLGYWKKHYGSFSQSLYAMVLGIHVTVRLAGHAILYLGRRDADTALKIRRNAACLCGLFVRPSDKMFS